MCRRPIYFKGFAKVRESWDEEAWETKCHEIFTECVDECIEDAFQMADALPRFRKSILQGVVDDVKQIERTFTVLKKHKYSSEDIDFVLNETDECLSDRWKYVWYDEPRKEKPAYHHENKKYFVM